jgi:hypothetical protein
MSLYKRLTHTQLIKLISQAPQDELAWYEFIERFHAHICGVVYRECKRLNFDLGIAQVEDFTQDIYRRLLNNNCIGLLTHWA